MNILVTGSNGFLGREISKQFRGNSTVYSLNRGSGDYRIHLDNEIPLFEQSFDVVIHAAGKAHSVPKTVSDKKQFHDVNVIGTKNLLKGLERKGFPNAFVFISSVAVYGLEIGNNINEEFPLQAKDAYGLSKIEAEKMIVNWCQQNNVVCTILRLPLLVGENPPGNLGSMIKAIDRGYYFNIGGGKARKSMVLVQDVASFIPLSVCLGGVYNLTDGYHPSFLELSTIISEKRSKNMPLNLPLPLAKLFGFFGDLLGNTSPINSSKVKKITSDLLFDDSKAKRLLNWNPEFCLEYLKRNII